MRPKKIDYSMMAIVFVYNRKAVFGLEEGDIPRVHDTVDFEGESYRVENVTRYYGNGEIAQVVVDLTWTLAGLPGYFTIRLNIDGKRRMYLEVHEIPKVGEIIRQSQKGARERQFVVIGVDHYTWTKPKRSDPTTRAITTVNCRELKV